MLYDVTSEAFEAYIRLIGAYLYRDAKVKGYRNPSVCMGLEFRFGQSAEYQCCSV